MFSYETILSNAENFMVGYHVVFDRENMKLGWYRSECKPEPCHNKYHKTSNYDVNTFLIIVICRP